jgi:23S rRNA (uracil1939-C5)-methyltransferase
MPKFQIIEIDPLGQGVAKEDGEIFFIQKTLPEEMVTAEVFKKTKGVNFAKLISVETKSKDRIESECPHFNECPGCHFLHTNYENEISFKQKALQKIFRKWDNLEIESIPADNRLQYRNRLQLHYDKNEPALGFYSVAEKKIIPVPLCLIAEPAIQEKLKELYAKDAWVNLLNREKPIGHIEIYLRNGEIKLSFNSQYAESGFSQVNQKMNAKLVELVTKEIQEKLVDEKNLIDLFGGSGNLTQKLSEDFKIDCIDVFKQPTPNNKNFYFHKIDLYKDESLTYFLQKTKLAKTNLLMLDPPRSGFKFLSDWCDALRPDHIVYVSCDPQTMQRDLEQIKDQYSLEKIALLDLFPGTYHFETMATLRRLTK